MRILQIGKFLPPVTGGIETVMFELSRGLAQMSGVSVDCLVSNTSLNTIREKIEDLNIVRVGRLASLASTPICPSFRSEGDHFSPHIAHFHLPNPMATWAFSNYQKPYVVTYHCDIVRYPMLLKLYNNQMTRFLNKAQKIIVSSRELIESSRTLQDYKGKCKVIPFGIETDHLAPTQTRKTLTEILQKQFGEKTVLFIGRLVKYKGLHDLISAMSAVNGNLVIIGTGPERRSLEKLATKLKIESKIHFVGYVAPNEIAAYCAAAKVMALTSINESEAFGMSLLDGLALGIPLLTTKLKTGVSSVNIHGVTGFQVPVGDVKTISENLTTLLTDPVLRERMSRACRLHFEKNFQLKSMVQEHFDTYLEVLQK